MPTTSTALVRKPVSPPKPVKKAGLRDIIIQKEIDLSPLSSHQLGALKAHHAGSDESVLRQLHQRLMKPYRTCSNDLLRHFYEPHYPYIQWFLTNPIDKPFLQHSRGISPFHPVLQHAQWASKITGRAKQDQVGQSDKICIFTKNGRICVRGYVPIVERAVEIIKHLPKVYQLGVHKTAPDKGLISYRLPYDVSGPPSSALVHLPKGQEMFFPSTVFKTNTRSFKSKIVHLLGSQDKKKTKSLKHHVPTGRK